MLVVLWSVLHEDHLRTSFLNKQTKSLDRILDISAKISFVQEDRNVRLMYVFTVNGICLF